MTKGKEFIKKLDEYLDHRSGYAGCQLTKEYKKSKKALIKLVDEICQEAQ